MTAPLAARALFCFSQIEAIRVRLPILLQQTAVVVWASGLAKLKRMAFDKYMLKNHRHNYVLMPSKVCLSNNNSHISRLILDFTSKDYGKFTFVNRLTWF